MKRRRDSRAEASGGLDRPAAVEATRRVLAKASRLWASWRCPTSGRCCQLSTTGRSPWLWPSEWWLLEDHLQGAGRAVPGPRGDGGCCFLDEAGTRCTVYEARPFGCRTYFCEQGRGPTLPGLSTHRLLDELAGINVAAEAPGAPRPIEAWCLHPAPDADDGA